MAAAHEPPGMPRATHRRDPPATYDDFQQIHREEIWPTRHLHATIVRYPQTFTRPSHPTTPTTAPHVGNCRRRARLGRAIGIPRRRRGAPKAHPTKSNALYRPYGA